jgi:hypothetical protein
VVGNSLRGPVRLVVALSRVAVAVAVAVVVAAAVVVGPVRVLVSGAALVVFQRISAQRMSGFLAAPNCLWRYHDEKH